MHQSHLVVTVEEEVLDYRLRFALVIDIVKNLLLDLELWHIDPLDLVLAIKDTLASVLKLRREVQMNLGVQIDHN